MQLYAFVILLVLLTVGGSSCATFQERENPASVLKGEITGEKSFNEFTMRMYRSDDEGSFEILRGNQGVYVQSGGHFYLEGRGWNGEVTVRAPMAGADITGNGKPDLVVYEWTGGAHCCYIAYVFELGRSVTLLAQIDGRHSAPKFVDLDGDSLPEVILCDCTFAYWPESFAASPAPEVVLRWDNGQYIPDAALMEIPAPSAQALQQKAENIRNDDLWNDLEYEHLRCFIPQELFQTALDLMYGGHEELGREFIKMAWSTKYPLDNDLLAEFDALLLESPYWPEIKRQRASKDSSSFRPKNRAPITPKQ